MNSAMTSRGTLSHVQSLLLATSILLAAAPAAAQRAPANLSAKPAPKAGYVQLIAVGYDYFTQGKLKEAYTAALMAAQVNPNGFESYALAAAVMHVRREPAYAKEFVDKALARADASQKAKVRDLATVIDQSLAAQVAGSIASGSWSGALKGTYTYERSASKPLDATFAATLQPGGTGSATFNTLQQSITWTQTGQQVVIRSVLKDYGCAGTLIIGAMIDGTALKGTFMITGAGCAEAKGTWTATRVRSANR